MRVEIINTGTELLLGKVQNTHLVSLAQSLFSLGLRVEQQVTVPDGIAITDALREAKQRGGLILVTGGLGPTSDDVTREATCEVFHRSMHLSKAAWEPIVAFLKARGYSVDDLAKRQIQEKQAMVAEGAILLMNRHGTAPGWILPDEASGSVVILLPGPPRELIPMWNEQALPWLRHRFGAALGTWHEVQFRILGVGETQVQSAVEADLIKMGVTEVGYCARLGEVDLRLLVRDASLLPQAEALVRHAFAEAIYASGTDSMEEVVIRQAQAKGLQLTTAESCTGGLIVHRLTNVAGSSQVFSRGWVTYSNEAKSSELSVPEELIRQHGAVSEPVARAMAEGALAQSGADLAIAVTGIAGPGGGSEAKPVGLVYFGLAHRTGEDPDRFPPTSSVKTKRFLAERTPFKDLASQYALNWVRLTLEAWPG